MIKENIIFRKSVLLTVNECCTYCQFNFLFNLVAFISIEKRRINSLKRILNPRDYK